MTLMLASNINNWCTSAAGIFQLLIPVIALVMLKAPNCDNLKTRTLPRLCGKPPCMQTRNGRLLPAEPALAVGPTLLALLQTPLPSSKARRGLASPGGGVHLRPRAQLRV